jgi:hypothetical protein
MLLMVSPLLLSTLLYCSPGFLLRLVSLFSLSTLLLLILQPLLLWTLLLPRFLLLFASLAVYPAVGVLAFAVHPAVADVPAAVSETAFVVAQVPDAVGLPAFDV